jgi:hypothetical protein
MSVAMDDSPLDVPDSRFRSRPMGLAVGFALAAVLVLGVAIFFASGTDDVAVAMEDDEPVDTPETPEDAPADDAQMEDEAPAEPATVVTYEVYLDRDPFEPVRTPPEPEPEVDDNGIVVEPDPMDPDDPSATDPDTAAPRAPDDPSGPSDPANGRTPGAEPLPDKDCAGDSEERVCNGEVVSLNGIGSDEQGIRTATVQVGTQVYEVRDGDNFATHYRVRGITTEQVTLSFGDETFTLSTGDRVMK